MTGPAIAFVFIPRLKKKAQLDQFFLVAVQAFLNISDQIYREQMAADESSLLT